MSARRIGTTQAVSQNNAEPPIIAGVAYRFNTWSRDGFVLRPVQDKLRFSSVFHDIQAEINLNRYMVHRFRKLPTDGQFVDVSYPDVKRDAITFFDDITPDSNDWKNKCFASYFKLDKVTLVANH